LDLIPIRDRYENIHPKKKEKKKRLPNTSSLSGMKKPQEKPIG
jgi:hypothetical protein